MCNVEEDGVQEPVKREIKRVGRKCVKCDQPGILITRIHDSFCRDCFQVYVVHKFRSAIGKSKLIRDGEKVLVAFSGGANSSALLHLIKDGLSERAHKKLRFRPTLLHVDECTALEVYDSDRLEIQNNVADIMLASGFPSYVTSLEQCVQKDLTSVTSETDFYWEALKDMTKLQAPASSDQHRLKTLFSSLSSMTCKEDFLRNLRRQLIITVARHLGLKKVLTGDCSTRLSVQILTDISQGRGSQVSLDTAFSDARYDDIMVVRPVRDLNTKELAMYNHLCGVESLTIPSLTTKAYPGASIERLTETFITGLQADFPSTVSNIVRTSEKLLQPDTQSVTRCSFCQSPLDTNVGASSALNAIRFSKKLSQSSHLLKQQKNAQSNECCDNKETAATTDDLNACSVNSDIPLGTTDDGSTVDAIMSSLCFGCQLSLRNFDDDYNTLPSIITSKGENLTSEREKMKEQLSGYLLNDSQT